MNISRSPYYEKSRTVLWALTTNGIVLHNFANREFIELKEPKNLVWAYLDGVHHLEDVSSKIVENLETWNLQPHAVDQLIQETFEQLLSGKFIVERVP